MHKSSSLIISTVLAFSIMLSACGAKADTSPEPTAQPERVILTPAPTVKITYTDGIKEDGCLHVYLQGNAEKLYTPESSFIDYISYYADSEHMIICMNGKDYVFANVSAELWYDFKAAESKGSFYQDNIRGETRYHVNDYNGENGDLIVLNYVN